MKTKSVLRGDTESSTEMNELNRDINGEPIHPVWAAEFRGFFWGEGTLAARPNKPVRSRDGWFSPNGYSYIIHATIGLRADDGYLLREFQRRLGGVIRQESYRTDPNKKILRWEVTKIADLVRIAKLLGDGSALPFNKKRQLDLWTEAVHLKMMRGGTNQARYTQTQSEKMFEISRELRRLKEYDPDWITD